MSLHVIIAGKGRPIMRSEHFCAKKSVNNSNNKIVMYIFISFYPFPWCYAHPSTAPQDLQELWTTGEDNSIDHQTPESLTVKNVMSMVLHSSSSPEMHLGSIFNIFQHSFIIHLLFSSLVCSSMLQIHSLYIGTIYVC